MFYRSIGISKQAVHKYLNNDMERKEERCYLFQIIYQIRQDHPTMCVRDMYYKIKPTTLGRDAFEHMCKIEGLSAMRHFNYSKTTNSNGVIRFDNLLINLSINRIDQVWQSDITYFDVRGTFYYITFILDSYSRRIVGHSTSMRLTTEQTTLPAIQLAFKTRGKKKLGGLILHSDGGGQYYDKEFLALIRKQGLISSMCEYPWDNGKAERINGVIKNNYLIYRGIATFDELKHEVDRSVKLYNYEKPHIALQRKTPITFENEILSLQ
jgi:putative transposase